MGQNYFRGCDPQATDRDDASIQLAKNIVNRLNIISTLLYEMKAGTPLGKTVSILINLYRSDGKATTCGTIKLADISLGKLARLAEISVTELQESLDFLAQKGIIFCRPASGAGR